MTDIRYSKPTLRVLCGVYVVSAAAGNPEGNGADLEDVRDYLIDRFGWTVQGAEDAIQMARSEGAIEALALKGERNDG